MLSPCSCTSEGKGHVFDTVQQGGHWVGCNRVVAIAEDTSLSEWPAAPSQTCSGPPGRHSRGQGRGFHLGDGYAGEHRGGDSGMQGVCTEVAGMLEEVANHEEEEESPELPAPASAPARFSAAVKSAMVAARAAGVNPAAAQRRWVCLTLRHIICCSSRCITPIRQ